MARNESTNFFSELDSEVVSTKRTVLEETMQIHKSAALVEANSTKICDTSQLTNLQKFNQYNFEEMKEIQRKKANKIASACNNKEKNKAALMFQKRFERSEKFALVHDPSVNNNKQNKDQSSEDNRNASSNQAQTELLANVASSQEEISHSNQQAPPELPMVSFLKVQIPTDKYLPSPKPWQQTIDAFSPQPAMSQIDFNRCAKGFTGPYTSPYRQYCYRKLEETCEL